MMIRHALIGPVVSITLSLSPTLGAGQSPEQVAACHGGDMAACNAVGIVHDRAGRDTEAVRYFRMVCDGGVAVGCSNLAEKYYDGRGVGRDLRRAFSLFSGACQSGVLSGCAGACVIAEDEGGLTQEQASTCRRAVERACAGGNPWMCSHVRPAVLAQADNGCRTGGAALANAILRWNPIYAMFFGDLESYVAANRAHFVSEGDAIRCAKAVSQALLSGAIASYDPDLYRRREEMNTQLGTLGISPGPSYPSPSAMLYGTAQQVSWLGRVLPAAAQGNYEPLRNPETQEQMMQLFAGQMLAVLLQDPSVRSAFLTAEPMIREAANGEYQFILAVAQGVAN